MIRKLISNNQYSKCIVNIFRRGICAMKLFLSKTYAVVMMLFDKLHIDRTLLACITKLAICISLICYLTTWFFKATHNIEYTIDSEVAVLDGLYRIDTIGIDISMSPEYPKYIRGPLHSIEMTSSAIIKPVKVIQCSDLMKCEYKGKRMDSICAIFRIHSLTEIKYAKNSNDEEPVVDYKYNENKHIFTERGNSPSNKQQKRNIDTWFISVGEKGYSEKIELGNHLVTQYGANWIGPKNTYRLCINFNLRWKNKNLQDIPKSTLIIRMNEPTDFVSIYPEPDVRTLSTIEYHDINKLKSVQSHGIHLLADSLENKNKHELIMLFIAACLSILLSATFSILWKTTKIIIAKYKTNNKSE